MKFEQRIRGAHLAAMLFPVLSKCEPEKIYQVVLKEVNARSIDQNALMWMWLTDLARHFSAKGMKSDEGEALSKDDMHDIMRHKFLGYETVKRTIGQTVIEEHKLKSTASLEKGEMHEYLTKMDQWALEHGCFLPHPEDSEYMKLREAQTA